MDITKAKQYVPKPIEHDNKFGEKVIPDDVVKDNGKNIPTPDEMLAHVFRHVTENKK